jgi:hypothetical protein
MRALCSALCCVNLKSNSGGSKVDEGFHAIAACIADKNGFVPVTSGFDCGLGLFKRGQCGRNLGGDGVWF